MCFRSSQNVSRPLPTQTIDLTQDADEVIDVDAIDNDDTEFYCRVIVDIVGTQYYNGLLSGKIFSRAGQFICISRSRWCR